MSLTNSLGQSLIVDNTLVYIKNHRNGGTHIESFINVMQLECEHRIYWNEI